MKVSSVLVLAIFLGKTEAIQLRNQAAQLTLAECEAAKASTGQVLAGCEAFFQKNDNIAQPAQAAQAPVTPVAPVAPAAPAFAQQAGNNIDAAQAAAQRKETEEAQKLAQSAVSAASKALQGDAEKCKDDFCKTLGLVMDSLSGDENKQIDLLDIIKKEAPCGVTACCVMTSMKDSNLPMPNEDIWKGYITEECIEKEVPPDELEEPEIKDIIEVVEDVDPKPDLCPCDVTEGDKKEIETIIKDAFVDPVDVEIDDETLVVTVTDPVTDKCLERESVKLVAEVKKIIDEKELAIKNGDPISPIEIINAVQQALEDETARKAEAGLDLCETPDDVEEECCCGCCCCCDEDEEEEKPAEAPAEVTPAAP